MLFRNFTPFPPLQFESRDEQQRDFGVVVVRGTFKITPNKPLSLEPEQEPLVMADVYHGEPGKSSLRLENNLAPYKPKTDIHLQAVAQAPHGRAIPHWRVGVIVGQLEQELQVTGERYWQYQRLSGWQLTDPKPCTQVPLHYEYAYGGSWQQGEETGVCEENSVGLGYVNVGHLKSSSLVPAPRIMSPKHPVLELGKVYKPEGFGPLAPAWQPRLKYAGTFDLLWEKTRWPDLPADFKFDFYNSAHPDLIYPEFMMGNETIKLFHLSSIFPLIFTLPDFILGLLVRWEDGQMAPLPMMLDTVHIEVPEMKVYLVWRGIFPLGKPIRVLEVRMKVPESVVAK